MTELLVGLDAIALVRETWQAGEPDPAASAVLAELAGADGVSVGLRTDRRHVQERDVKVLRALIRGRLQVRIPPTADSLKVTVPIRPDGIVLVPERPDVVHQAQAHDLTVAGPSISEASTVLREAGLEVLALVEPESEQVKAAHRLGLAGVSLLGTRLAAAREPATIEKETDAVDRCVQLARKLGLRVQVAHGLGLAALHRLSAVVRLHAVEVGQSVAARALHVGMERAVTDHREALSGGRRR